MEMKSYINSSDSQLESMQASRGFKSYHDLCNKKIMDAEHATKLLKETQQQVKNSHEKNMAQCQMFGDLKKLLKLKVLYNQKMFAPEKEENLSSDIKHSGNTDMLVL